MQSLNKEKGLSVIEIIVASAIIMTLLTAIGGGWQLYLKTVRTANTYTAASNLSEEGAEAIQMLRDISWSSNISPLSLNTEYDLYWDGTTYKATTTPQIIQSSFRRTITFSAVNRDAFDNIDENGGTTDINTRKVTINIYSESASTTPILQSQILVHNTYAN